MPGPEPKARKHGRTPNAAGSDWTEVPDAPFDDAPPLPPLGGPRSRKKWHPWTEEWYADVSTMPHAALWRPPDWRRVFDLARMKDDLYKAGDEATTSQATEIRRREDALGCDYGALRALKIRYVPVVDESAEDEVDGRQVGVDEDSSPGGSGGKVLSLQDRRAALSA